jgi:hypothetical protein
MSRSQSPSGSDDSWNVVNDFDGSKIEIPKSPSCLDMHVGSMVESDKATEHDSHRGADALPLPQAQVLIGPEKNTSNLDLEGRRIAFWEALEELKERLERLPLSVDELDRGLASILYACRDQDYARDALRMIFLRCNIEASWRRQLLTEVSYMYEHIGRQTRQRIRWQIERDSALESVARSEKDLKELKDEIEDLKS